jgi:hypothetical protein
VHRVILLGAYRKILYNIQNGPRFPAWATIRQHPNP